MSDNAEKIEQFIGVTGVNQERADFFLAASNWNLELALESFYNEEGENNSDVEIVEQIAAVQSEPRPTAAAAAAAPSKIKKTSSKFATIHTINNSSDEEEDGQAFYAGGSEHSGQQVLGPKKKDIAADMLKSIREHGVEVPDDSGAGSSRAFRGTGYKLGQTTDDTETVRGTPDSPKPVRVTLKLWRDGFSVDEGELRYYTDPANHEFLNSIRRGEIPSELRRGYSEVDVSMEDHRMESFPQVAGRASRRPFSGPGHTLGSPTPPTVGAPLEEDKSVNEANARENLHLDSTLPTTNLQIRLADGTRLVGQFNHTNTIRQIRSYILLARPQYETRSFTLLSAYPPRELQDTQTLIEADILNAAIIQKLN